MYFQATLHLNFIRRFEISKSIFKKQKSCQVLTPHRSKHQKQYFVLKLLSWANTEIQVQGG